MSPQISVLAKIPVLSCPFLSAGGGLNNPTPVLWECLGWAALSLDTSNSSPCPETPPGLAAALHRIVPLQIRGCLRNKHWKSAIPRSPAPPRVHTTLAAETLKSRELQIGCTHTPSVGCWKEPQPATGSNKPQILHQSPETAEDSPLSPQRLGSDPNLASPNSAGKSGRDGMCRREAVACSSGARELSLCTRVRGSLYPTTAKIKQRWNSALLPGT